MEWPAVYQAGSHAGRFQVGELVWREGLSTMANIDRLSSSPLLKGGSSAVF